MDARSFQQPGKEYRSAPFWSWNDDLQDAELIRQIREMDAQGMGGFFMHSRVGLVTPYMSHEWMDRIRACVDEARRTGMQAWLYDEDKWPSGYAGGLTTAHDPARRAKALAVRPAPTYVRPAEEVAAFVATVHAGRIVACERMRTPPADPFDTARDRLYLPFLQWTAPLGNEWFNSYAYADLLDHDTVRTFLDVNYEPYWREFGSDFGGAIPGIFTDEPCYMTLHANTPRPRVPWTTNLPRCFSAARGYDLLDHLPSLFYDVGDFRAVRYDFWRTVTDLFVDAFWKQTGDWCEAHHCKFTGHALAEDSLHSQILVTGAAMPAYEYMHQPGMDHLSRNIQNPLTARQLDSAACQLGKSRTLTELFGCSGQNMSFVDRKWIADWHQVLGINLMNPHLSLYSMRGARKRDYPPNIFYQQPWWPDNRLFEDYCGRLSYALTQGKRSVDVLVLHPIASAWTLYRPEGYPELLNLDQQLAWLVDTLAAIHRDFHLGDDRIMSRHATVESGQLRVGEMAYRVVVVPPGNTLEQATFDLLTRFLDAGGRAIAIEPLPTLVAGRPEPALAALLARPEVARIALDRDAIERALADACAPVVTISGRDGRSADVVWYHLRRDGDRTILFLANTDHDHAADVTVTVPASGLPTEWLLATGDIVGLPAESAGDATRLSLHFEPAGSHLIVFGPDSAPLAASQGTERRRVGMSAQWQIDRLDRNSLTLDYCEYRLPAVSPGLGGSMIGSAPLDIDPATGWSRRTPIWNANRMLRGDWLRGGTAGNWYNVQPGIEQPLELRLRFDVCAELAATGAAVGLVVETPERFGITVNGVRVPAPAAGWWLDPCWRPIDITSLVRAGENVIELTGTFFHDTELESCYLVGDFDVELSDPGPGQQQFRLVPSASGTRSALGLERSGLTFYAGRLRCTQTLVVDDPIGRCYLDLGQVDAITATVRVNGQSAGTVAWHPWRVEVTGLLQPGRNTIEVELANSLHNLLGPHHHQAGELPSVSPASFVDDRNWTDRYTFARLGIVGASLVWVD